MPDPTHDFRALRDLVRRHLPPLRLSGAREQEIVDELAQLLADKLADASEREHLDLEDQAAVAAFVREQVPEWQALARALEPRLATRFRTPFAGLRQDLRSALRLLVKNPLLTGVTVLTLSVAVGLNSAMFSLVNGLMLRSLGVEKSGELVRVFTRVEEESLLPEEPLSHPDYRDLRDGARGLSDVAAHALTFVALEVGGEARLLIGEMATGNYFHTLGVHPARGRLLEPADDRPDAPPVVVIGYDLWQTLFGGRTEAIGSSVRLNGREITVVGVAPQRFRGLLRGLGPELWLPLGLAQQLNASGMQNSGPRNTAVPLLEDRGRRFLWVVGRQASGGSFVQARSEIATIGERLRAAYPDLYRDRSFTTLGLDDVYLLPGIDGTLRFGSTVLLALVALVMLIACANLASLLLARAASRGAEMATRRALGASRARLVRQLLLESLVLALLGAAGGLVLAQVSNRAIGSISLPSILPLDLTLHLDRRVLLFTLLMATGAAIAFGLAPALVSARAEAAGLLRSATQRGGSRHRLRPLRWLVVLQVAASTVLLICAGLVAKSAHRSTELDRGLESRGVVLALLDPELQGRDPERSAEFFRRLIEEVRARPEVAAVAYASHFPLTLWIDTWSFIPEGDESRDPHDWPDVDAATVGPGYFATAGVPLLRGREFEDRDLLGEPRVAIVNQELAERYWPDQEALGKRLRLDPDGQPLEIVGIARNGKYRTLGETPRPFLYAPFDHPSTGRFLAVRFEDPASVSTPIIRRVVHDLDPHLAIASLTTLDEAMGITAILPRVGAALFAAFGAVGLFLAATGLYGVLAYAVAQRTHELGIRLALGAGSRELLHLVLGSGMRLAAAGLALGLLAAALTSRALRAILYGTSPLDPLTFLVVVLVLLAAAALATYLPARRAMRMDPLRALRHE